MLRQLYLLKILKNLYRSPTKKSYSYSVILKRQSYILKRSQRHKKDNRPKFKSLRIKITKKDEKLDNKFKIKTKEDKRSPIKNLKTKEINI